MDWNLITKANFATGSWDDTIKLWSPESPVGPRTRVAEPLNPWQLRVTAVGGSTHCGWVGGCVDLDRDVCRAHQLHLLSMLVALQPDDARLVRGGSLRQAVGYGKDADVDHYHPRTRL